MNRLKFNGSLDQSVLNGLAHRFGFKEIVVEGDAGGFSAVNTFLSCDGKRFVLKSHRTTDPTKIAHIENATQVLHERGLPVPLPIKGADGVGGFKIGRSYYTLLPRLNGFTRHEPDLTPISLYQAGYYLALIHDIHDYDAVGQNPNSSLTHPSIAEGSIILAMAKNSISPEIDHQTHRLLKIKRTIIEKFKSLVDPEYYHQSNVIHGDYHNQNLIFAADGSVVALLDFEQVDVGHPQVDIMNFINLACCNSGYLDDNIKKSRYFIEGYMSKKDIHKKDLKNGMYDWMIRISRSLFIEEKIYIDGCRDLSMLITRDYKRLEFLYSNVDDVIDKL